jgi:hypothetical protein
MQVPARLWLPMVYGRYIISLVIAKFKPNNTIIPIDEMSRYKGKDSPSCLELRKNKAPAMTKDKCCIIWIFLLNIEMSKVNGTCQINTM